MTMTKAPVDNYAQILRAMAQFILKNAPAGLTPFGLDALARASNSLDDARDFGAGYLSLEWKRRDGADRCDLYVRLEADYRDAPSANTEDEHGNLWRRYKSSVQINWPSFGSATAPHAALRIALMRDVTELATALNVEFGGMEIWALVATAQERAEARRRENAAAAQRNVATLVAAHTRGMREGAERIVRLDHEIPCAQYTVDQHGRSYIVVVTSSHGLSITRQPLSTRRTPSDAETTDAKGI